MSKRKVILVTGANGFVGRNLCAELKHQDVEVRRVARRLPETASHQEYHVISSFDQPLSWRSAVEGVEVVVHAAARAHVLRELSIDPLSEYRHVNCELTLKLARESAAAGVRRFIFISSIGVNGEETHTVPFCADDEANPHSFYAISKYEAEAGLKKIALETGMEIVIIRPPLILGPNAPGNLGRLIKLLRRGIPIPLGAVRNNRRSFVSLGNLIDLILTCMTHPNAANQTFLISDDEDLSTLQLVQRMSSALRVPVKTFYVPVVILKMGAITFGKREIFRQLCGSLQVDIKKTRELLDWSPRITVDEELSRIAKASVDKSAL